MGSRGSIGSHVQAHLVLYDGGCGVCSRTVSLVSRLDVFGRVRFADVVRDWERLSREHPALDRGRCLAEMHVITPPGRIAAGFDACRSLAWVLPLGWLTLPLLYFPGVAPVGRRLYRAVAAHRTTATACARPTRPSP